MSSINDLSYSSLINLAQALNNERLFLDASLNILSRYASDQESKIIFNEFRKFIEFGMTEKAVAYSLNLIAKEKQNHQNYQNKIEVVWTIPDIQGIHSRNTALIVQEIFQQAQTQLLISTYVIDRPEKAISIFGSLMERMETKADLDVRIILNIEQPYKSNLSTDSCIRKFSENFCNNLWQGKRLPDVFYDSRGFSDNNPYQRSCLHAKFIIADHQKVFLTSANFTEAAHQRNIEAGIIFDDRIIALKIINQVNLLINDKILVKLPGM